MIAPPRRPDGTLERDPANPHGLPPLPDQAEQERRMARLLEARSTADAALDTFDALRADRPGGRRVEIPPLRWWGDERSGQ